MAKNPPVNAPATIGLIKSYWFLRCIRVQSVMLNNPPHKAKDPPKIGALLFNNYIPPKNLSFLGAKDIPFRK